MKREDTSNELNRRIFIRNTSLLTGSLLFPSLKNGSIQRKIAGNTNEKLNIIKKGKTFILDSPYFAFCHDTTDGLKALWWQNKLTGRKLNLGDGEEIEITIGLPGSKITRP